MRVRVLSRYTQVVKQSNSVSLETPTTSSEVACKKKLAREFGLPHFLLLNQTHEVWFSFTQYPRFCLGTSADLSAKIRTPPLIFVLPFALFLP